MRIADIFPDGRAILVSDGIIKARYRVIDSVEVKVWATAWALNYPRFEANPNNGGPFVRDNPMYPSTSVREMTEQSDKNIIISANMVCWEGEIKVYNVSGRVLFEGRGCTQPLKRGVYFVRIGNRIKSIIIR